MFESFAWFAIIFFVALSAWSMVSVQKVLKSRLSESWKKGVVLTMGVIVLLFLGCAFWLWSMLS